MKVHTSSLSLVALTRKTKWTTFWIWAWVAISHKQQPGNQEKRSANNTDKSNGNYQTRSSIKTIVNLLFTTRSCWCYFTSSQSSRRAMNDDHWVFSNKMKTWRSKILVPFIISKKIVKLSIDIAKIRKSPTWWLTVRYSWRSPTFTKQRNISSSHLF